MNGFQHLPEYASAAQSYRREHLLVERTPRRPHASVLGRIRAAIAARPAGAIRVAR